MLQRVIALLLIIGKLTSEHKTFCMQLTLVYEAKTFCNYIVVDLLCTYRLQINLPVIW